MDLKVSAKEHLKFFNILYHIMILQVISICQLIIKSQTNLEHQTLSKDILTLPVLEMPHQFQCKSCPQNYKEVSEFIKHVKIHVIEKDQNKEKLQASMLQRSIDIKLENEEIQSYICGKDLSEPSSESRKSKEENEILLALANFCDICDKTFFDRSTLKTHIKTVHRKVKELRCNLCNMSFGQNKNLQRHVKTVHQKITAFKCDSCDKSFRQKAHLETHVKTVHDKIKDHECDSCEKRFGQKGDLERHNKTVHGN